MSSGWTAEDLPDLSGRTIVVTGGNSGIGFEATRALAGAGARAVLACRDLGRADEARQRILAEHAEAQVDLVELDLANLDSVRKAAEQILQAYPSLDVLCNNAGVMAIPKRHTADGFEMQIGTNHLGHFALTGLLIDRLLATPGARVVNVSSTAHRAGRMRFDDLHWERGYSRWPAYGQSKLANLLFTFELQRRLEAAGSNVRALACHPGYAATNLQLVGPQMDRSSLMESLMGVANRLFAQSAAMGALPTVYAAAAPEASGGDYIGPDGFMETWGHPKRVGSSRRSRSRADAEKLWQISEELTGVRYDALRG